MGRNTKLFGAIAREHVEGACRTYIQEGGPEAGGSYFVRFDGKRLPAKRILQDAYRLANGVELPAREFSGGTFTARILEGLGFEILVVNPGPKPA